MSLAELYTILTGITGFTDKVAYHAFPVGAAPALPFIVYREAYTRTFAASGKNYYPIRHIVVELYTKAKDPTTEGKVETALDNAGVIWEKSENYIDTEKCFQIMFDIEI